MIDEAVVKDVLELVGKAEPLAGGRLASVEDDLPATGRPARRGRHGEVPQSCDL
jgi:hypothetical protein